MGADSAELFVEWVLEAPVAGLDLAEITDTNASDRAAEYDRLRGLGPIELEEAFLRVWPGLRAKLTFRAGAVDLQPEIAGLEIPEVGDIELPRVSTLRLRLELPPGDDGLVIGWTADLGPLVVRQRSVEGGYAGYLTSGALTDPIPRSGIRKEGAFAAFAGYIGVGFDHIVPKGLDHILFVLGLFFLSFNMRPLLWQVTAFTLAHTVTLALGALDILRIPPGVVEPLIAASILYVSVENLLIRRLAPWRPAVVFGFGLLHGLGFAAVLQDFGLGSDHFVPKLIGFNLGVELGQLAVIGAAWAALGLIFGALPWYHRRIGAPVSVAIAAIAFLWVLERTGIAAPEGARDLFSALTGGGFDPFRVAAGAAIFAVPATIAVLIAADSDRFRDTVGFATSAVLFAGLVATFSTGDWMAAGLVVLIWVLALRFQALGGVAAEPTR